MLAILRYVDYQGINYISSSYAQVQRAEGSFTYEAPRQASGPLVGDAFEP